MDKIAVMDKEIGFEKREEYYLCLTDMVEDEGQYFIVNWLRNRNTLEYIGIWESLHNPNFNCVEFDIIKSKSGLNNFRVSVKEFVERTNAISLFAKAGRYGGTYAHKDIAFEFGMWISPKFKIYLVKEFQRLKEIEYKNKEWNAKRELAKVNYKLQTNAIKENLIVPKLTRDKINYVYASEADLLNVALFGKTASEWRKENKELDGNMRDYASIEQLLVLANMESYNSILIEKGMLSSERIVLLNEMARSQIKVLVKNNLSVLENKK